MIKIKNNIYTIIVIYALIALFLVAFLIYPSFKDIQNDSLIISSNKDKTSLIYAEMSELNDFKKKYESYKPNLEKIDKSFVDSQNPVNFIEFLEKVSSDSGVTSDINLISSQKKIDNDFSISVFQIFTKGDVLDVLNFIEKLEKSPYLVEIQKIMVKKFLKSNINNKEDLESKNNVDVNLLIEVVTK